MEEMSEAYSMLFNKAGLFLLQLFWYKITSLIWLEETRG